VAMVISAVALITWFVAGIVSASHPPVGALRRNEESA
jgi:hypothetical protein